MVIYSFGQSLITKQEKVAPMFGCALPIKGLIHKGSIPGPDSLNLGNISIRTCVEQWWQSDFNSANPNSIRI